MKNSDKDYTKISHKTTPIPDNHVVMDVKKGVARFKKYGDLDADTQKRIEEAIQIVKQNIRRTRDSDPEGNLSIHPFGEELWCKIDVIEGALGVGCGIGGYWCSVWIHPDLGVAANCGNVHSDD